MSNKHLNNFLVLFTEQIKEGETKVKIITTDILILRK